MTAEDSMETSDGMVDVWLTEHRDRTCLSSLTPRRQISRYRLGLFRLHIYTHHPAPVRPCRTHQRPYTRSGRLVALRR